MTQEYDVVVIGFGPAGAVAAALLGQAGLRTLVIDRSRTVHAIPRAIAIDHEIMRIFQNLGVADQVLPHVAPFTASEHFGAQGQLIRRIDMVEPPYPLGYIPSMVFTQPPVEAALRAHVAGYPSVEIALGWSFQSLIQQPGAVRLTLAGDQGDTRTVTTRYVIGCDGASSDVRKHLAIPFEDLIFDEPWVVIDVLANPAGLAKLPAIAAQYCEPARPSTYILGPGNHRRWEIMLQDGEDPLVMQTEPEVWKLLARWITPADGTLWRASSYRFHALVARDWRVGHVFIAGDAAHQQPPFIGQGMCQGIRDAANLSWKLIEVIAGRAAPALLDTYAAERGRHVRTLTARIKAIGHMICERDPIAAAARDAALLASNGGVAPSVTRQDIVPPLETGLLAAHAHPANGTLFPQPWIIDTNTNTNIARRRLDDITGTGWRLICDGRTITQPPRPTTPITATAIIPATTAARPSLTQPECLSILTEQDGVVTAWFERHHCIAALVRPDHYVYGVAINQRDITTLLNDWCTSPAAPPAHQTPLYQTAVLDPAGSPHKERIPS